MSSDASDSQLPSNAISRFVPKPLRAKSRENSPPFFNFFNTKEPSQQAFKTYQRQLRRKGARGPGQVTPGGMQGVSTAKLPPTVPRVNSKWDGIPSSAKEKTKEGKAKERPSTRDQTLPGNDLHRTESMTSGLPTSFPAGGTKGAVMGDLGSSSSLCLANLYRWERTATSKISESNETTGGCRTNVKPG